MTATPCTLRMEHHTLQPPLLSPAHSLYSTQFQQSFNSNWLHGAIHRFYQHFVTLQPHRVLPSLVSLNSTITPPHASSTTCLLPLCGTRKNHTPRLAQLCLFHACVYSVISTAEKNMAMLTLNLQPRTSWGPYCLRHWCYIPSLVSLPHSSITISSLSSVLTLT